MQRPHVRGFTWRSVTVFLTLSACGADVETHDAKASSTTPPEAGTAGPVAATVTAGASAATASMVAAARPATTPSSAASAGSSGNTPVAGARAADGGGAGGSPSEAAGEGIPCEVTRALANACHRCHGPVPINGAPMPLVTLLDFQTLSVGGRPKVPKYELALMRMNGSRRPPMPPATSPITDEDKQTLIDWLSQGAPPGDPDSCL